jgi:hypothetical protein
MNENIDLKIINKGEGLFLEITEGKESRHYGFTHKKGKKMYNTLKFIYG